MSSNPHPPIQVINLGFVNAFLIPAGDAFILVDTGISQQWSRLENALRTAGCLPDRLKLVVITHGDADHTGGCVRLRDRYHARIAMHAADVPLVESGQMPKRITRGLGNKLMVGIGGVLMKLTRARPGGATFTPDILLQDGQSLSEYGLDAVVLHTPGHTPGSICILTGDGQLLTGDTFTNNTRPDLAMFIQDPAQLQASVERIKGLKAITVFPGHGKPFPFEKIANL